jgi:protein O-mannosyl-transferase
VDQADPPSRSTPLLQRLLLVSVLLLATWAVYAPTLSFPFISYDDPALVSENEHVRSGLTWEGARWAFAFKPKTLTYWHPMTWLAHMLNVELFGLDAGRHHLINLALHTANVLTLFLLLDTLTGAPRRSALVAALFALHPINVESVAWVAGLKNLLSTLLWLAATAAYVAYCRRPRLDRYLLTLSVFCLGLLAKPMLVTFPATLLLLDLWPLARLGNAGAAPERGSVGTAPLRLVIEKLPLVAVSLLSYYLSTSSLEQADNVVRLTDPGLGLRAANALVSYPEYLVKLLWPRDLLIFYPFPVTIPAWQVVGSGLLLVGMTWGALSRRRSHPYLVVGWLWFIGTLAPVIGLVQAGLWPALADRWAYVPAVGLFIAAAWAMNDLLDHLRIGRATRWTLVSTLLLTLGTCTWVQVGYWRSSSTLFQHILDVDPENYLGLTHLGAACLEADDPASALPLFRAAARVNPASAVAEGGLGVALSRLGDTASARDHLERALAIRRDPATLTNLGTLASLTGDHELALTCFAEALAMAAGDPDLHNGYGVALAEAGRVEEAAEQFRVALDLDPLDAEAEDNLRRCERLLAGGRSSAPSPP